MFNNDISYKLLKTMLKYYISVIVDIVSLLQQKMSTNSSLSQFIKKTITFNYMLLMAIIRGSNINKNEACKYINIYITNVFDSMHAEELIT